MRIIRRCCRHERCSVRDFPLPQCASTEHCAKPDLAPATPPVETADRKNGWGAVTKPRHVSITFQLFPFPFRLRSRIRAYNFVPPILAIFPSYGRAFIRQSVSHPRSARADHEACRLPPAAGLTLDVPQTGWELVPTLSLFQAPIQLFFVLNGCLARHRSPGLRKRGRGGVWIPPGPWVPVYLQTRQARIA